MGISYDPPSKKWNINYEKTDNKTDLKTDNPVVDTVTFYAVPTYAYGRTGKDSYGDTPTWKYSRTKDAPIAPPVYTNRYGESSPPSWAGRTTQEITVPIGASREDIANQASQKTGQMYVGGASFFGGDGSYSPIVFGQNLIAETQNNNKNASESNKYNADLNARNLKTNTENATKNAAYDKTYQAATTAKGGDYVTQREIIRSLEGIDDKLIIQSK